MMFIDKRQLAVFAGGFCAFTNLYPVQALLPDLVEEFNVSATTAGLVVAASPLAVAVVAPFVGLLSDLLGRKPVMVASLACLGTVTLAAVSATSTEEPTVWRFLSGLFVPGIFTVLIAYIREEWDPPGAAETLGFYISGTVLGGFSSRFIAGWVTEQWGWEAGLAAIGLLNLALLWTLVRWLPASRNFQPGEGVRPALRAIQGHLTNRRLLSAFFIASGILFNLVGVFTFVGLYLALPRFFWGRAPSAASSQSISSARS